MNFLFILMIAILSTQLTRQFVIRTGSSPIRASSALTLIFVFISSLFTSPLIPSLQASFLGATFVGMSEPGRMTKKKLLTASIIFSLIFYFLLPHSRGLGGALGCAAFTSCVITLLLKKVLISFSQK